MLRPDRMSKVSIAGSKAVLPAVIETTYDLNLVHLSDYDGSWDGFDNGTPLTASETVSEKLVTVRSIESKLDIEAETPTVSPEAFEMEALAERLETVQADVNELDDRRERLQAKRRDLTEQIDSLEPFADVGIDLDLLHDYDRLSVVAGYANATAVEEALAEADEITTFEVFAGGDALVIAAPHDAETITGALVAVEFTRIEIPHSDGDPQSHIDQLREERTAVDQDLAAVNDELVALRQDVEEFVLRAEAYLSMQAQQADIPLKFATTQRSFIAEGWVPTNEFDTLVGALQDAVGDRVEVEEIERAAYETAAHHDDSHDQPAAEAEEASEQVATDGGQPVTMDQTPPSRMNNVGPARPFEKLVQVVGQPKYSELDPTLILFLTYPLAFGFMISDVGYGILYILMGVAMWQFRSEMLNALGTIGVWAGVFTGLFGVVYDDFFGLSTGLAAVDPTGIIGAWNKGYEPYVVGVGDWVLLWFIVSVAFGVIHMAIGYLIRYKNERPHGFKTAVFESVSWILALFGLYFWLFSEHVAGPEGPKPDFLAGPNAVYGPERLDVAPAFIATGFPEGLGIAGLGMFVVGVIGIYIGEGPIGILEIPSQVVGQSLSYVRMLAVLLAKGGMALVVVIGTDLLLAPVGEPQTLIDPEVGVGGTESIVGLLLNPGQLIPDVHIVLAIVLMVTALFVFVFGHIVVLLLGITAAGIQMIRLEYVEFFQKFYEGGGEKYQPFGSRDNPPEEELT